MKEITEARILSANCGSNFKFKLIATGAERAPRVN